MTEPSRATDPVLGLSSDEAAARTAAGMANVFRAPVSRTYLAILRQNAYPAINGPLVAISVVLAWYGLYVEALLTAAPVLFNIGLGVVQEARAKRALDRIAILNRPRATVIRDGIATTVDLEAIVRGDLVEARRGDQIVVDGELVGDGRVELDEALLTGESDPVARERGEAVRSGTAVLAGEARYVATRVGAETTANRIIARSRLAPDRQTPLQREVARTIWIVAGLVVAVALVVVLADVFGTASVIADTTVGRQQAAVEAAAVLVTLVPQGLAIMLTVTYAAGALRISRLGALVQRQRAVESMSRVDTLCIDKTGTLTTQVIRFAGVVPLGPAVGSEPVEELLAAMAAATTVPDRTTAAITAGLPAPTATRSLAEDVPFASDRRWSGLRFTDDPRPLVMGAAMVILPRLDVNAVTRHTIAAQVDVTAAAGHRVLVVARAPATAAGAPASLREPDGSPHLPERLDPVALLLLTEELRPDARTTLDELARGGVQVRIVSGDDPMTVDAVARTIGMAGTEIPARAGPELEGLDDRALDAAIAPVTRFGRVDPDLKARLVAAFRRSGHYVAMIGDGVNDVLPLRGADLSVAMASGAAATRAAADLVLLGDAFGVLPRAVLEGRRILAAMQATLVLLLSRTFSVLLIVAVAALLGLPFPITPRQNAVLALFTVGAPLILLVLWVPPARTPRQLLRSTLRTSIPAAAALAALSLGVYGAAIAADVAVDVARTRLTTVAVFAGLGLLPLIRPARRPTDDSPAVQRRPWLLATASALVYLILAQWPAFRDLYGLAALPAGELVLLLALAIAWTIAVHGLRWVTAGRAAAREASAAPAAARVSTTSRSET